VDLPRSENQAPEEASLDARFESLYREARNATVRGAVEGEQPRSNCLVLRHAFSPIAGGCGRAAWQRSFVAFVRLPHVCCASLSQHTFFVGRIRLGWVLWAMIH